LFVKHRGDRHRAGASGFGAPPSRRTGRAARCSGRPDRGTRHGQVVSV
jgi:hypothetical protein